MHFIDIAAYYLTLPFYLLWHRLFRRDSRHVSKDTGALSTFLAGGMIEGTVPFLINGEEFRTYYQIHGTIADDSLPPLIAIHGGPGYTHDYLGPLADIAKSNPLQPIIFYDQLGNGKSSRLTSKPPDFFSVRLYVDEIANLVEKLNLTSYHILGHSWGGPLAAEFEVQLQPRGLKSLIIANSLASMALVGKSFSERIDTLDNPEEVRAGMAKKKTDPKAYRAAMMALYGRYAIRYVKEDPIPKELRVLDTVLGDEETGEGGDPTVSDNMGPKTRNWTIIDRLPSIRVPLLLLTGKEDMLQGYASEPYFWRVKKALWIEFQNSSHVPFWEEREKFMTTVNEWLQRLD